MHAVQAKQRIERRIAAFMVSTRLADFHEVFELDHSSCLGANFSIKGKIEANITPLSCIYMIFIDFIRSK